MLHVALKKQWRLLAIRRRGKGDHGKHARTDLFRDRLDRTALAGGIPAFEQDDDPELVRLHPFLEVAKLDLELSQLLLIGLAFHPWRGNIVRHAHPSIASCHIRSNRRQSPQAMVMAMSPGTPPE